MNPQRIEFIVDRELGRTMRAHCAAAMEAHGADGIRRPGWHHIAAAHLRRALDCCEAIEAMLLVPPPRQE